MFYCIVLHLKITSRIMRQHLHNLQCAPAHRATISARKQKRRRQTIPRLRYAYTAQ